MYIILSLIITLLLIRRISDLNKIEIKWANK